MQSLWRQRPPRPGAPRRLTPVVLTLLAGCASPGPPRPPSLQHTPRVCDLGATRSGDTVVLRFTVPARTTDGQPPRESTVQGGLCRQMPGSAACTPVDLDEVRRPLQVSGTAGSPTAVLWTDHLPPDLLSGSPRLIAYRVELRNAAGHSAGLSDPTYTVAGPAPPSVAGIVATGTRLGIALRWVAVPGAGEVILERTEPVLPPAPKPARAGEPGREERLLPKGAAHKRNGEPGVSWLQANPDGTDIGVTLDTSVVEGTPYQYTAVRQQTVHLGGRTLVLRSAATSPVGLTWRDVYPPPRPEGMTGLGYTVAAAPKAGAPRIPGYAVDLVWQPVSDPRLAGYLGYRQALGPRGETAGPRARLTAQPEVTPGYHDTTALPGVRYRYSVTSIDPKGNESAPAETVVEPTQL